MNNSNNENQDQKTIINELTGYSRRSYIKAAGATAVAAQLAGCTGGTDNPSDTEDSSGDQSGDELVHLAGKTLTSLDPHKAVDDFDVCTAVNHYDPLVYLDVGGEISSHIATDWSITADGNAWEFTLREGVKTHAGNEITADDVVYSAERFMDLGQGFSSLFTGVVSDVEKISEYEVRFNLENPYSQFITSLVLLFVLDADEVRANEQDGDLGESFLGDNVAGSGPYRLDSYTSGDQVSHVQFEDYWGGWEDQQFESVRSDIVQEASTQRQLIRSGDADISDPWLAPEAYEAMAESEEVTVPDGIVDNTLFCITMNCQKQPTDDINVRKAITHSFDFEAGMSVIGGQRATGPVPVNIPGHHPDLEPRSRDLSKAEEALNEAEYSLDEINEGLEIVYPEGAQGQRRAAELMAENAGEVGIEIDIQGVPWANFVDSTSASDTSPTMCTFYQSANIPSPDAHTYLMYHPDSHGSWPAAAYLDNDEVNELLDSAHQADSFDKSLDMYKEIQEQIVEQYPAVMVSYSPFRIATNVSIGGFGFRGVTGLNRRFYDLHRED